MGGSTMDGVYSQGYGIFPKIVLSDPALTLEAKVIYAYLAVYSGSKFGQYFLMPSEKRICGDLCFGHVRYYKHRKKLIESGYLRIVRSRTDNSRITLPRAVLSQEVPAGQGLNYDDTSCVSQEGILSRGYGLVPRLVLYDSHLSITAKAYYSYCCAFAAANVRADRIVDLHLKEVEESLMSRRLIKAAGEELVAAGYIDIAQSSLKGYATCILLMHPNKFQRKEPLEPQDADTETVAVQESIFSTFLGEHNACTDSLAARAPETPLEARVGAAAEDADHNTISATESLWRGGQAAGEAVTEAISQAVADALAKAGIKNVANDAKMIPWLKNDTTATGKNDTQNNYPNITIKIDSIQIYFNKNEMESGQNKDFSGISVEPCNKNDTVETFKNDTTVLAQNSTTASLQNDTTKRRGIISAQKGFNYYFDEVCKQIDAYGFWDNYGQDSTEGELITAITTVMAKVYSLEGSGTVAINGKMIPVHTVEEIYRRVESNHVATMCTNILTHGDLDVQFHEAYLRTCIYNSLINGVGSGSRRNSSSLYKERSFKAAYGDFAVNFKNLLDEDD